MKMTEQQEREALGDACSDMSKDAFGFRKRIPWMTMPIEDLRAEYEEMKIVSAQAVERERAELATAVAEWEAYIAKMMKDFRIDRATAISWDMEANNEQDIDSYTYHWNLPWNVTHQIEQVLHA